MSLNYIDLFAGCGGLSLGMYMANIKGIFAIEKNRDAYSTLSYNLLNKNHYDWPQWLEKAPYDINDVIENYSDSLHRLKGTIDIVLGGPPCQGFSMAGKRDSGDKRNELYNSYLRFIELVKPRCILFENVHGFTVGFTIGGIKKRPVSEIVIEQLEELGYCVSAKLIDVSDYGIPQRRKRYIIIGFLEREPINFFDVLFENKGLFLKTRKLKIMVPIEEAIGDLLSANGKVNCPDSKGFMSGLYGVAESAYQVYMRKNVTSLIPDSHRYVNHREDTVKLFLALMKATEVPIRLTPKHKIDDRLKKRGVTPLKAGYICNTITSIPDDYIHYCEPRIMSVREVARIQGFPDWFSIKGKYTTGGHLRRIEVPRYTQIANAVPPLFAEQIGTVFRELLK